MSDCQRCQLPCGIMPGQGTLYIAPPLEHTEQTLRNHLHGLGVTCGSAGPSVLSVPLTPGLLETLGRDFGSLLSQAELEGSRSLIMPEGETLGVCDLARMQPLSILSGRLQGKWLMDILEDERLETHLQPIVYSEEPSRVFAQECLLRGRDDDGKLVSPGRLFGAAASADLLHQLDKSARLTAVATAARHSITDRVFINFNPSSIYDPVFCLRTTISAIRAAGLSPEQIVFEVVESSQATDEKHLLNILAYYRERGFRVALDDLGAGFSSLNMLSKVKPDFIKLDMELIRDVDKQPYKAQVAAKLLEMARELGAETIAEGIETEGEWRWARDHGAHYVQGYLFGKPQPPVLTQATREAALV